ncbi:Pathogenesis-related protein 1 [Euphorbia peplus]|nr:Pathogenesis-related protein 1 [Euphorbia peplus]
MSRKYFSALIINILTGIALIIPAYSGPDGPEYYLKPHNEAREAVGVPPIKWDPKLAEYAKETASRHKKYCELEHSMGPYTENIAGGTGDVMTGTDATNMWVGEKQFWDSQSQTCYNVECGHYTSIVDPRNTKMGCAKITCPNGGLIFQCDYSGE